MLFLLWKQVLELGLLQLLMQARRWLWGLSELGLLLLILLQTRRGLWGLSDLGRLLLLLSHSSYSRRAAADRRRTDYDPSLRTNDAAGRAELLLLQARRGKRGLSDWGLLLLHPGRTRRSVCLASFSISGRARGWRSGEREVKIIKIIEGSGRAGVIVVAAGAWEVRANGAILQSGRLISLGIEGGLQSLKQAILFTRILGVRLRVLLPLLSMLVGSLEGSSHVSILICLRKISSLLLGFLRCQIRNARLRLR